MKDIHWKNLKIGWEAADRGSNWSHWVYDGETKKIVKHSLKTIAECEAWIDGVKTAQGGYEEVVDIPV